MTAFGESGRSERIPLVTRRPKGTVLHINVRFRVIIPPLPIKKPAPTGSAFLYGNKVSGLFSKLLLSHVF